MAGVIFARQDLFPDINEYAWSRLERANVGWDQVLLWFSGFEREEARLLCIGRLDDDSLNARALAAMRAFLEKYFGDVPALPDSPLETLASLREDDPQFARTLIEADAVKPASIPGDEPRQGVQAALREGLNL